MIKKVFLVLSLLLLGYLWFTFFGEYMANHGYYTSMLSSWDNGRTILSALIFALAPAIYLLFARQKNFWWIAFLLLLNLFFFGILYIGMRSEVLGWTFKFLINTILLFGIALYTLASFTMVGTFLKEKFLRLPTTAIFDILMNLGLGLAAFLLVTYILVLTNLFLPVITWLVFLSPILLYFVWPRNWKDDWTIVSNALQVMPAKMHHIWYMVFALPFIVYAVHSWMSGHVAIPTYLTAAVAIALGVTYWQFTNKLDDRWGQQLASASFWAEFLIFVLVLLSIGYLDLGYMLAYIPYPTAWDANHAYMFFPKMWAAHHGYYRNEVNMAVTPHLWYIYITFWFSLVQPFGSLFGISADTVAIHMNFWSGIFVLLFGLGLISEVIWYLGHTLRVINRDARLYVLGIGWFLLLQWLTSGMGAFLVFIDNKTDLWVMALIILAMYSGFYFLRSLAEHSKEEGHQRVSRNLLYAIGLSWFFYAIAALAKPTAMFDVVNFGLFLRWIWFGILWVVGVFLVIIGALSAIKFVGISSYFTETVGKWLLTLWWGLTIADIGRAWLKKFSHTLQYLLIWTGAFLAGIIVIKGPFMLAHDLVYSENFSMGAVVKNIFLGKAETSPLATSKQIPLYAQVGAPIPTQDCTLSSVGVSDVKELYTTLKSEWDAGSAYAEDVGRYVGYGWKWWSNDARRGLKPFIGTWWGALLSPGCYTFNPFNWSVSDAALLCEYESTRKAFSAETWKTLLEKIPTDSAIYNDAQTLGAAAQAWGNAEQLTITYSEQFTKVDNYMQENTIKVMSYDGVHHVLVPYKYLNIFNITFNWSLQNLSSYYTDIGIMWLLLVVFIVIGLGYGICTRNYALTGISTVTIFGWLLWMFVGGGILWYAIGIVVWTILAFIFFIYTLLADRDANNRLLATFLILGFFAFGILQMALNLARIASQGGGWAFIWYKTNNGRIEEFDQNLQRSTPSTNKFTSADVFKMQFPHYNDFLDRINARAKGEWVVIAGTYARYFIEDQSNIIPDNMLGGLWLWFSDNDPCKSYLRLKDKHVKYIVIDPNIGTVVQGAGNNSLFDRFFGKIDTVNNKIIDDGAFTMLAKLAQKGLVRHVTSNNIGAKYAFSMPDSAFIWLGGDDLALFRARMAVMRFFGGAQSPMFSATVDLAAQRVKDGSFVNDLAEIMGAQVRQDKMLELAKRNQIKAEDMADLTNDERKVMSQLLGIRQNAPDDASLKQVVTQLINSTIGAGNQLIVLEVVD